MGGKDIGAFEPLRPGEYVLYDPKVLDAPRSEGIFTASEKIIVQEIRNISLPRRIVATLDRNQTYALQSTNVINRRPGVPELISLRYILAVINSSTVNYFFRQSFSGNNHIASNQLAAIPIHSPSKDEARVCEILVDLLMLAKRKGEKAPAAFLEDLTDACVMECYFREHMAERDLLFIGTLTPQLVPYDVDNSDADRHDFFAQMQNTLNAPSSKIRNQLLRLTADSPDLLAVIKAEGKV